MDKTIDYLKDLYELAEIGCKAELIEDIFDERGSCYSWMEVILQEEYVWIEFLIKIQILIARSGTKNNWQIEDWKTNYIISMKRDDKYWKEKYLFFQIITW